MASPLTLGLDLGPNSIGWALIDEDTSRLVAAGVRVFPEGVDRDKQGGERSKNEDRRTARGMRRQIARRARRKKQLRAALVQIGLLPADEKEQKALDLLEPYALRRRALEERLEPYEIGRMLIHLNQRRGFLSNRKTDRKQKTENSKMLAEISTLAKEIHDADDRTLGEHLARLQETDSLARVRGRHTRRDMCEAEFEAVWAAQQKHHPELLTDQLKYGTEGKQVYPCKPKAIGKSDRLTKYGLHGLMFFQRPMYWPASVVGRCELEPKRKRCPRGDRQAQRFRLLQEVNNLRLLDPSTAQERPLSVEQRTELLDYLAASKEPALSVIL
jgi:CRISPR-associated endonuclease Csn1